MIGYQNDVRSVDVFRYNTGIIPVNKILIHQKRKRTTIECLHKAADSKFLMTLIHVHFVYFY